MCFAHFMLFALLDWLFVCLFVCYGCWFLVVWLFVRLIGWLDGWWVVAIDVILWPAKAYVVHLCCYLLFIVCFCLLFLMLFYDLFIWLF